MFDNKTNFTVEESETIRNRTTEISQYGLILMISNILSGILFICHVFLPFVTRRRSRCLGCCWGRPGISQPVDFVDEIGRRWAYAACSFTLTIEIVHKLYADTTTVPIFEIIIPTNDPEWMKKFGWITIFINLADALILCLKYYPLLACIDHRHSIAANILGLLYLAAWILPDTMFLFYILSKRKNPIEIAIQTLICISFYVIGFSYILDLVRNIRRKRNLRCKPIAETEPSNSKGKLKRGYTVSHHFEYVANLLQKRKQDQTDDSETRCCSLKKLLKPLKYDKIFGFRYSTRLFCCMTVCVTLVFLFSLQVLTQLDGVYNNNAEYCDRNSSQFRLPTLLCWFHTPDLRLMYVALSLTDLFILCFLFNTLINYRRRWHQLLRGDHSWHMYGPAIASPSGILVG